MRALIFGASGMLGRGLLLECLRDPAVTQVLVVGRRTVSVGDPKVVEYLLDDVTKLDVLRPALAGVDACFWCLGISSAGLDEAQYRRITYTMAVEAARRLAAWSPAMNFVFVSGTGADSTERGPVMWARVKGEAENALLAMPFRSVYAVRPAFIQPLDGITSRTRVYRFFYRLLGPTFPLLRRMAPRHVTTTSELGRAMLALARRPAGERRVLEQWELNEVARDAVVRAGA